MPTRSASLSFIPSPLLSTEQSTSQTTVKYSLSITESIVADASKITVSPEIALLGAFIRTIGGKLRTVTDAVDELLAPSSSVAWNTMLCMPAFCQDQVRSKPVTSQSSSAEPIPSVSAPGSISQHTIRSDISEAVSHATPEILILCPSATAIISGNSSICGSAFLTSIHRSTQPLSSPSVSIALTRIVCIPDSVQTAGTRDSLPSVSTPNDHSYRRLSKSSIESSALADNSTSWSSVTCQDICPVASMMSPFSSHIATATSCGAMFVNSMSMVENV